MSRLALAVALGAAVVLGFEIAPKSTVPLAMALGLYILVLIYDAIFGVVTALREARTVRFWIVLAGLVFVSLAAVKLR
jgi:hypothetical protein